MESLKSLASETAVKAITIPGVELVVLMGSVAVGVADALSDVDLLAFYTHEPTEQEIGEAFGKPSVYKFWLDTEKFSVALSVDGISTAVVFMDRKYIDQLLGRYPEVTLEEYKQLAHTITHAEYLVGDKDLYDEWNKRIGTMPTKLRGVTLTHHVASLRNFFIQKRILKNLERKDWLFINSLFSDSIDWAIEIVYTLNNIPYASSKFARKRIETMDIKPKEIVGRLEKVSEGENTEESLNQRTELMAEISQELAELVEQNTPSL